MEVSSAKKRKSLHVLKPVLMFTEGSSLDWWGKSKVCLIAVKSNKSPTSLYIHSPQIPILSVHWFGPARIFIGPNALMVFCSTAPKWILWNHRIPKISFFGNCKPKKPDESLQISICHSNDWTKVIQICLNEYHSQKHSLFHRTSCCLSTLLAWIIFCFF